MQAFSLPWAINDSKSAALNSLKKLILSNITLTLFYIYIVYKLVLSLYTDVFIYLISARYELQDMN
jgi:hypothetical protein